METISSFSSVSIKDEQQRELILEIRRGEIHVIIYFKFTGKKNLQ